MRRENRYTQGMGKSSKPAIIVAGADAQRWQIDLTDSIAGLAKENDVEAALTRFAEDLDFEYCAYGMRVPVPVTRPRIHMTNNYPKAWRTRYTEQGYIAIDPTVRRGQISQTPMVWSDTLFAGAQTLWDDARDAGLRHGWAQSTCSEKHIRSLITLARSAEPIARIELAEKEHRMRWLTQALHTSLTQRYLEKLAPQARAKLTERERTVLRWAAVGKTVPLTSEIMRISERTVAFHRANAQRKLDAPTITSASVAASMLNLLW